MEFLTPHFLPFLLPLLSILLLLLLFLLYSFFISLRTQVEVMVTVHRGSLGNESSLHYVSRQCLGVVIIYLNIATETEK